MDERDAQDSVVEQIERGPVIKRVPTLDSDPGRVPAATAARCSRF
jgi:hypothetical protein